MARKRHTPEQVVNLLRQVEVGIANPTNFLYTNGRLSAVLDFDMAAAGPLLYDVGCLLYWWACPAGQDVSLPRGREVLAAYQAERPLLESEREHIYDALLMVMLMGAGWSAASDEFWTDTRGVEALRRIGRAHLLEELNP